MTKPKARIKDGRTYYTQGDIRKCAPFIEQARKYWNQLAKEWVAKNGKPGNPTGTGGIGVLIRARKGGIRDRFILRAEVCEGNEQTWEETSGAVIEFLAEGGLKNCAYGQGFLVVKDFASPEAYSGFCHSDDPQGDSAPPGEANVLG